MSRLLISNICRSLLLLFLCCFNPLAADAQEYQQAANALENLASEIRMNEAAVGQVLMEAMQSKHGDMQKWNDLDAKMAELGRSIDANLPEISRNAAIVLAQNPDQYVPSISLGRTFEGNLRMATDKRKQLGEQWKAENDKLMSINAKIAKVTELIGNAQAGSAIDAVMVLNPLPDDFWEFGGEATIAVLALYSGPVGWVALAGTAAAKGISMVTKSYYNAKSLKERLKVYTELRDVLQEKKKIHEDNMKTLRDGEQEMRQIEQTLEKHEKKMTEYKARVNSAMEALNNQYKSAFDARKQKLDEEVRKMADAPKPDLKPNGWVYGMDPIPPISSGEYSGEVNAMISQMRSYAQAVEDGGDPDNFQIMVTDWHNRLHDRHKNIKKELDQKREAHNQATQVFWRSYDAASAEYDRAWRIYVDCRDGSDRCYASLRAAGDRYNAAVRAAYAALRPFGQAMINPYRELIKIDQIHYRVRDAFYPFRERVDNAAKKNTRDFWNQSRLWETKFDETNAKVYDAVAPVPYWIDQWKSRAERLDDEIQSALYWGRNIADVRAELLSTAKDLRDLHKTVQEAAKKYESANQERIQTANKAQSELNGILTRYGRLINYYWASNFSIDWLGDPMEFTPRAPDQEKNITSLEEYVKKKFTFYEPEHLKKSLKLDIPGIAAQYENKARELTFYTDWVDTYRHRASTAVGALDRISVEKTGQYFYSDRGGTVPEVLSKEFGKPPWSTIAQDAEKYVSKGDFASLPWGKFQSWENLGIWQKLYAGQTLLLNKLNKDAKNYVQARSNGWFMAVPAQTMDPLIENWKKLREVSERFDKLAKPEHDKLAGGQEQAQKEAQPVFETWGKMPKYSRDMVAEEYRRFSNAYNWLQDYIRSKFDATRTTLQPPNNSVAVNLDNLILGYAPAYEKWKKQQEEADRRAEEQRRQWEAAEKARLEKEKKQAEEEAQRAARAIEEEKKRAQENLSLVKDFYVRFKEAYEERNDSRVISMISDQWQAGDGTTLSDLQMTLRRTFKTFDEIRYNVQNLSVTPLQGDRYSVSYDVTITSRIYKRNLRHEEKSSINEEVTIEKSGKAKISRTLGGRFWYVQ